MNVCGSGSGSSAAGAPVVVLHFNDDGAKLFEQITAANVGKQLAIFLDGEVISSPVIQEAIPVLGSIGKIIFGLTCNRVNTDYFGFTGIIINVIQR